MNEPQHNEGGNPMIVTERPLHLYSTARLSALYQRPVAAVMRAAERAGVVPVVVLNDAPHYSEDALDAIQEALALPRPRPMA